MDYPKQKGQTKHTRKGMAYEQKEEKRYCPMCDKKETRSECSYGPKIWDKYSVAAIHPANEAWKMPEKIDPKDLRKSKRSANVRKLSLKGATPGEQSAAEGRRKEPRIPLVRTGDTSIRNINAGYEPSLVDKILEEILQEGKKKKGLWDRIRAKRKRGERRARPGEKDYPETLDIEEGLKKARRNVGASKCWTGYKATGTKIKDGEEVPDCKKEDITIEDANGNTFAEITDIISIPRNTNEDEVCPYCGCDPCECEGSDLDEAIRIPTKSGNLLMVVAMWRGKTYALRVFFPQTKMPTKKEVEQEIQKIYPDSRVTYFKKVDREPGQPFLQVEEAKVDKDKMKCNEPKAQAVGDSLTGKSHVVKACEGGKEEIIRFGQRGVKGSPKKEGESEEYASRRRGFQTRHAKNIARGKMSAAYWANEVKWKK